MSSRAAGYTLIEVTIAAALLVTIALGTAQLLALATAQHAAAQQQLVMGNLAADKIEELALAASDGGVTSSPADALDRNELGFSDFADGTGALLATAASSPDGAMYVRRWSVGPLTPYSGTALAIVVRVTRTQAGPGDAQLATICLGGPP